MAVRIQEIAVRDLGPLQEFIMEMGDLNLIYGRNETGKTYLVEFLIRSLFRSSNEWALRDQVGSGQIIVTGVSGEPLPFSPEMTKKLEHYWEEDGRGLPTNLARLLVVKAAEAAIIMDDPGGVNRAILKSLLSRDVLLDEILDNIPVTLQRARIVDGTIEGNRRGDIKRRLELLEDHERIERLFRRIDQHYSGGPRRQLEIQKESLAQEKEELLHAKRHLAYVIDQEIKRLRSEKSHIPDSELESLASDHRAYQQRIQELECKKKQLQSLGEASSNYLWTEEAIRIWESRTLDRAVGPARILLILSGASLVAGATTLLLNLNLVSLALFLVGAGLAGIYVFGLHRQLASRLEVDELRRLSEDYEARFGEKLTSLAELKRRRNELQEAHFNAKNISERGGELRIEIENLSAQIAGSLRALIGEDHEPGEWQRVIGELKEKAHDLAEQIRQKEMELAKLGIDEAQYSDRAPAREFDPGRLAEVEEGLRSVETDFRNAQEGLNSLKQAICNETDNDITTPWPEVLEELRRKYNRVEDDYRQVTADILAQVKVTEILQEIKEAESERIREGLKSDHVSAPLLKITGQYTSLDMVDDRFLVTSAFGRYPLSDLSTGTREQVLLALRMGFASMLTGGEPLFLILDDAFQHSDWLRRERLVAEVVKLAKGGWQIVYLTMDDHLRNLFRSAGEEQFGDAFAYKELHATNDKAQGIPG